MRWLCTLIARAAEPDREVMNARRVRQGFLSARGAALIEFTVVAPVMMLMLFGIARFGITFNNYVALTDAVRVGARQLSMGRGQADPCRTTGTKINTATSSFFTSNRASFLITTTVAVTSGTTTSSGNLGAPSGSLPTCSGAGATMTEGADATVTATYPCSIIIFGINFAPSCTLSSSTTARIE